MTMRIPQKAALMEAHCAVSGGQFPLCSTERCCPSILRYTWVHLLSRRGTGTTCVALTDSKQ
jgi:hypothetical protein